MTFNLQYGEVLSIAFFSRVLISNGFLSRNGKTQTNWFFGTIQILGRFINTLREYIFMQRSTKVLGKPLLRKICFNFRISKCRVLWEEQIIKPRCNIVETKLYLYNMGKQPSKLVKAPVNIDFLQTDV